MSDSGNSPFGILNFKTAPPKVSIPTLQERATEQHNLHSEAQKEPLTQISLEAFLEKFLNDLQDHSLKARLSYPIAISENVLTVKVPSQLAKEGYIEAYPKLASELASRFSMPRSMELVIEVEHQPHHEGSQLTSPKEEIIRQMAEKNPLVMELIKKWRLLP